MPDRYCTPGHVSVGVGVICRRFLARSLPAHGALCTAAVIVTVTRQCRSVILDWRVLKRGALLK
jgi:hypothetical protein